VAGFFPSVEMKVQSSLTMQQAGRWELSRRRSVPPLAQDYASRPMSVCHNSRQLRVTRAAKNGSRQDRRAVALVIQNRSRRLARWIEELAIGMRRRALTLSRR
jgi:hypothetical protein